MIYRYIYKITCTAGSFKDKFYFGQHTTNNLDDNYIGSGRKLLSYLKKYPNDYVKEIISFHNTEDELNKAEYDIIHPWLGNEMCLNIQEGGYYGKPSYETRKKMSKSLKGRIGPNKGKKFSKEWCKHIGDGHRGLKLSPHSKEWTEKIAAANRGRKNSEETKKKISDSCKGRQAWNKGLNGIYNHTAEHKQYISNIMKGKNAGKRHMSNGINHVFIHQDEIEYYLSLGYHFGTK